MAKKKTLKSLITTAKRYEKLAFLAEKRSSELKERPTIQSKVSKYFKVAGDAWAEAGNRKKAIEIYNKAIEYAESNKRYADRIENKIRELDPLKKILEKRIWFAVLSMISLVFALFFSISSLTGYSINGLGEESFRLGGVLLFVVGLVLSFFYFKGKK